nr:gliding motility-associated C-terminal domain-containing protein [Saprospiraceae bacterium]
GCDSIFILEIEAHQVEESTVEVGICEDATFVWNGVEYSEQGLYTQVFTSNMGCDSTVILDLSVGPLQSDTISAEICEGEHYLFYGNEYSTTGQYTHSIEVEDGCDREEVLQLAIAPINRDTIPVEICEGDEFNFHGQDYSVSGQYIHLIEAEQGCNTELILDLDVKPNDLIVDLGEDKTINLGDEVQINAWVNDLESNLEDYYFSPGDWLNCTYCMSTISKPLETITYEFTVVGKDGCEASDEITIFVDDDVNIYVPNIFSPNKDGINDRFYIFADSGVREIEEFKVFDRWGNKVFENYEFQPNDPLHGWDGTFKGQDMNPAVFAFYAIVSLENGGSVMLKGDVTLVR